MSAANRNVTNCKGYCVHYQKTGTQEICTADMGKIVNGYASGFCTGLERRKPPTHKEIDCE